MHRWRRLNFPRPGVPSGILRVELGGQFDNYDSRFLGGTTQDILRDYSANPVGGAFLPTLADPESRIARIIGQSGYRLSLGRTTANGLVNIGRGTIGLAYGLTRRITVFASVPIVQTRVQIRLVFDSTGADAGFNPNDPVFGDANGRGQTSTFLAEFNNALDTLADRIASGAYDANPGQLAQAQQTLADGTALRADMLALLVNPQNPFIPLETSAAGAGMLGAVTDLQATLSSLSIGGFSSLPALARNRLTPDDFTNYLTESFAARSRPGR